MTPLRVAALTSGRDVPSARFRVRQHLPALRKMGFDIVDHFPAHGGRTLKPAWLGDVRGRYIAPVAALDAALTLVQRLPGVIASRRADLTWLERNFVPMFDDLSVVLKSPVVVDIDDAIWLYNPGGRKSVSRLIRRARAVIAGNTFLADWCAEHCSVIHVVPTAIDAQRFCPAERATDEAEHFTIGWTGSAANFRFLKRIEPALKMFLDAVPTARLMILAERRPAFVSIPAERITFRQWTAENEHLLSQDIDVGLMPLEDTEIARGKCSFKMLQYMACGIPCIVSPVGMNAELLAIGEIGVAAKSVSEWNEALHMYFESRALRRRHGENGRRVVLERYDSRVVATTLANVLRSAAH